MDSQFTISTIVADDEHLIAKNIAKNIERCHPAFQVISVDYNGEDALQAIRKKLPQVLFTDIRMPVVDGLSLVKKAKEILPTLICIIISGYDDFEYAQKAIQYGVTDYLLKPVNVDELTALLKKLEISVISAQENFTNTSHSQKLSTAEIVHLIEKYIQKHYMTQIDLNTLAQHFGFSSSYLTKIFTKYVGTTPSKYIRHYRMTIACQLLANSDLSIMDIASSVGYSDPFHFSKSFKSETGSSPSNYRQTVCHNE